MREDHDSICDGAANDKSKARRRNLRRDVQLFLKGETPRARCFLPSRDGYELGLYLKY